MYRGKAGEPDGVGEADGSGGQQREMDEVPPPERLDVTTKVRGAQGFVIAATLAEAAVQIDGVECRACHR